MLYSQIVLKHGMPFELRLPSAKPISAGDMSREQLDAELAEMMKGIESMKSGRVYTADEVDDELNREFNI